MNSVKLARYEAGMSISSVAKQTGIDRATLSRYENGVRVPTAERAKTLADLYEVSVAELLGLDGDRQTSRGEAA